MISSTSTGNDSPVPLEDNVLKQHQQRTTQEDATFKNLTLGRSPQLSKSVLVGTSQTRLAGTSSCSGPIARPGLFRSNCLPTESPSISQEGGVLSLSDSIDAAGNGRWDAPPEGEKILIDSGVDEGGIGVEVEEAPEKEVPTSKTPQQQRGTQIDASVDVPEESLPCMDTEVPAHRSARPASDADDYISQSTCYRRLTEADASMGCDAADVLSRESSPVEQTCSTELLLSRQGSKGDDSGETGKYSNGSDGGGGGGSGDGHVKIAVQDRLYNGDGGDEEAKYFSKEGKKGTVEKQGRGEVAIIEEGGPLSRSLPGAFTAGTVSGMGPTPAIVEIKFESEDKRASSYPSFPSASALSKTVPSSSVQLERHQAASVSTMRSDCPTSATTATTATTAIPRRPFNFLKFLAHKPLAAKSLLGRNAPVGSGSSVASGASSESLAIPTCSGGDGGGEGGGNSYALRSKQKWATDDPPPDASSASRESDGSLPALRGLSVSLPSPTAAPENLKRRREGPPLSCPSTLKVVEMKQGECEATVGVDGSGNGESGGVETVVVHSERNAPEKQTGKRKVHAAEGKRVAEEGIVTEGIAAEGNAAEGNAAERNAAERNAAEGNAAERDAAFAIASGEGVWVTQGRALGGSQNKNGIRGSCLLVSQPPDYIHKGVSPEVRSCSKELKALLGISYTPKKSKKRKADDVTVQGPVDVSKAMTSLPAVEPDKPASAEEEAITPTEAASASHGSLAWRAPPAAAFRGLRLGKLNVWEVKRSASPFLLSCTAQTMTTISSSPSRVGADDNRNGDGHEAAGSRQDSVCLAGSVKSWTEQRKSLLSTQNKEATASRILTDAEYQNLCRDDSSSAGRRTPWDGEDGEHEHKEHRQGQDLDLDLGFDVDSGCVLSSTPTSPVTLEFGLPILDFSSFEEFGALEVQLLPVLADDLTTAAPDPIVCQSEVPISSNSNISSNNNNSCTLPSSSAVSPRLCLKTEGPSSDMEAAASLSLLGNHPLVIITEDDDEDEQTNKDDDAETVQQVRRALLQSLQPTQPPPPPVSTLERAGTSPQIASDSIAKEGVRRGRPAGAEGGERKEGSELDSSRPGSMFLSKGIREDSGPAVAPSVKLEVVEEEEEFRHRHQQQQQQQQQQQSHEPPEGCDRSGIRNNNNKGCAEPQCNFPFCFGEMERPEMESLRLAAEAVLGGWGGAGVCATSEMGMADPGGKGLVEEGGAPPPTGQGRSVLTRGRRVHNGAKPSTPKQPRQPPATADRGDAADGDGEEEVAERLRLRFKTRKYTFMEVRPGGRPDQGRAESTSSSDSETGSEENSSPLDDGCYGGPSDDEDYVASTCSENGDEELEETDGSDEDFQFDGENEGEDDLQGWRGKGREAERTRRGRRTGGTESLSSSRTRTRISHGAPQQHQRADAEAEAEDAPAVTTATLGSHSLTRGRLLRRSRATSRGRPAVAAEESEDGDEDGDSPHAEGDEGDGGSARPSLTSKRVTKGPYAGMTLFRYKRGYYQDDTKVVFPEGQPLRDGRIIVPRSLVETRLRGAIFPLPLLSEIFVNGQRVAAEVEVRLTRCRHRARRTGIGNHLLSGHQVALRAFKGVRVRRLDFYRTPLDEVTQLSRWGIANRNRNPASATVVLLQHNDNREEEAEAEAVPQSSNLNKQQGEGMEGTRDGESARESQSQRQEGGKSKIKIEEEEEEVDADRGCHHHSLQIVSRGSGPTAAPPGQATPAVLSHDTTTCGSPRTNNMDVDVDGDVDGDVEPTGPPVGHHRKSPRRSIFTGPFRRDSITRLRIDVSATGRWDGKPCNSPYGDVHADGADRSSFESLLVQSKGGGGLVRTGQSPGPDVTLSRDAATTTRFRACSSAGTDAAAPRPVSSSRAAMKRKREGGGDTLEALACPSPAQRPPDQSLSAFPLGDHGKGTLLPPVKSSVSPIPGCRVVSASVSLSLMSVDPATAAVRSPAGPSNEPSLDLHRPVCSEGRCSLVSGSLDGELPDDPGNGLACGLPQLIDTIRTQNLTVFPRHDDAKGEGPASERPGDSPLASLGLRLVPPPFLLLLEGRAESDRKTSDGRDTRFTATESITTKEEGEEGEEKVERGQEGDEGPGQQQVSESKRGRDRDGVRHEAKDGSAAGADQHSYHQHPHHQDCPLLQMGKIETPPETNSDHDRSKGSNFRVKLRLSGGLVLNPTHREGDDLLASSTSPSSPPISLPATATLPGAAGGPRTSPSLRAAPRGLPTPPPGVSLFHSSGGSQGAAISTCGDLTLSRLPPQQRYDASMTPCHYERPQEGLDARAELGPSSDPLATNAPRGGTRIARDNDDDPKTTGTGSIEPVTQHQVPLDLHPSTSCVRRASLYFLQASEDEEGVVSGGGGGPPVPKAEQNVDDFVVSSRCVPGLPDFLHHLDVREVPEGSVRMLGDATVAEVQIQGHTTSLSADLTSLPTGEEPLLPPSSSMPQGTRDTSPPLPHAVESVENVRSVSTSQRRKARKSGSYCSPQDEGGDLPGGGGGGGLKVSVSPEGSPSSSVRTLAAVTLETGVTDEDEVLPPPEDCPRLYDGRVHVPLQMMQARLRVPDLPALPRFPMPVVVRLYVNRVCVNVDVTARIVQHKKHRRPHQFNYWLTGFQRLIARYDDLRVAKVVEESDGGFRVHLFASD